MLLFVAMVAVAAAAECPAGYEPGGDGCQPCWIGFYGEQGGLCEACPEHQTTPTLAATSRGDCECVAGYEPAAGAGCVRMDAEARCVPAEACLGDGNGCAAGYTGPECGVCAEGFFRLRGRCRACEPFPVLAPVLVVLFVAFVATVFVFEQYREPGDASTSLLTPALITLQFLQILSSFYLLRERWTSDRVLDAMAALSVVSGNLEVFAPECYSPLFGSFYQRWLLRLALPVLAVGLVLVVVGAFALVSFLLSSSSRWSWRIQLQIAAQKAGSCVLACLAATYLEATMTTLEAFSCRGDVLDADPSIQCGGSEWRRTILPAGVVAVVVYVVGIPVLFGTLVKRPPLGGSNHRSDGPLRTRSAFLYSRYTPQCYYWELVITMNRLAWALVVVLLSSHPALQVFMGSAVMLACLSLHCLVQPYLIGVNDTQALVQYGLTTLALFAVAALAPNEAFDESTSTLLEVVFGIVLALVVVAWVVGTAGNVYAHRRRTRVLYEAYEDLCRFVIKPDLHPAFVRILSQAAEKDQAALVQALERVRVQQIADEGSTGGGGGGGGGVLQLES